MSGVVGRGRKKGYGRSVAPRRVCPSCGKRGLGNVIPAKHSWNSAHRECRYCGEVVLLTNGSPEKDVIAAAVRERNEAMDRLAIAQRRVAALSEAGVDPEDEREKPSASWGLAASLAMSCYDPEAGK